MFGFQFLKFYLIYLKIERGHSHCFLFFNFKDKYLILIFGVVPHTLDILNALNGLEILLKLLVGELGELGEMHQMEITWHLPSLDIREKEGKVVCNWFPLQT